MKNNFIKVGANLFFITALLISFNTNAQVQDINTVAGDGTGGFSGDGGAAVSAELNSTFGGGGGGGNELGVAVDDSGNIYIADAGNNRIRKVNTLGIISTVAGGTAGGGGGNNGDGGAATAARLNRPEGVAIDNLGNIYIADAGENRIREVTASTGIISTVAGGAFGGGDGDGGAATAARLTGPTGVAIDTSGNLYIADAGDDRIRIVNTSGIINTFAGDGTPGFNGNGGPATAAVLNDPTGVAVNDSGNVYIADNANYMIREVTASTGIINTVAGTGTNGYTGDGAAATKAELDAPFGLTVDDSGNIYIADEDNDRIRKVNTSGVISTVAGDGIAGYSGDGGPATAAELHSPTGVALDDSGDIYIADAINNRIRAAFIAYPPVANFAAGDSSGCINTTIQFTDESYTSIENKPTSWKWTFTGGTPATSIVENPKVVYNTLGTYSVSLVVSNSAGTDSITKTDYITINPLPTVVVTPTTDTSCAGAGVVLTGSGALTYTWAPLTGLSASTGSSVTATPAINSIYTVTGTDVNGCTNKATAAITVLPSPKVTASASANPVCEGSPVTLTAKGADSYSWSGGVTNGVAFAPLTSQGYTVTGTDSTNGCSDTAYILISVSDAAVFNYTVNGYIVTFTMDSTSCATDGFVWSFGYNNSEDSLSQNPVFTYPQQTGGYSACLTCKSTRCSQCANISVPGNYSGSTSGINTIEESNGSKNIFPDPSDGQFTIDLENISGTPDLEIYNTLGQLVYYSTTSKNKELINLSNQPAGMYFIYLKSDESVEVGKILVTKNSIR